MSSQLSDQDILDKLYRIHAAVDDASAIVDPGEDETIAYEREIADCKELIAHFTEKVKHYE